MKDNKKISSIFSVVVGRLKSCILNDRSRVDHARCRIGLLNPESTKGLAMNDQCPTLREHAGETVNLF